MPHSILPLVVILAFGNVEADTVQRIDLPGFEKVPTGPLTHKLWEVQRVGREMIQEQLHVECLNDATQAHSGTHFIRMSLPKETVGFEYVTIGQRHKLKADRDYEAIVWVRWPDGPEQAPADARTTHQPSAIVSFWVRHQDATGDYAGRDVWAVRSAMDPADVSLPSHAPRREELDLRLAVAQSNASANHAHGR